MKQWEILTGVDRETEQGVVQLIVSGVPSRPDYLRLTPEDASALGMELMRAAAYAKASGGGQPPEAEPAADMEPTA